MSVLAIKNVPFKFKIHNMMKILSQVIKGSFEPINFGVVPKKPGQKFSPESKVLYIRLAPKLEPLRVIEAINTRTTFSAYVPKHVPNLKPLVKGNRGKGQFKKTKSNAPFAVKLLLLTHEEILTEMQSKFTGLYNLAKKTNFELMNDIALTVFNRLQKIADCNPEFLVSGFRFSNAYRKSHPHFGDFQLILSTLHKLQDAAGVPRAHVVEADLCQVSAQPYVIDNVPMDKVQNVCGKYSERIIEKILAHIESLDVQSSTDNAEEDAARKRVREQLKKLSPFMPKIVREVILNHFIPQKAPYHKVRIYGEPFLPNREQMTTVTKRCGVTNVTRSDRMYNLLKLSVPLSQYHALFSNNGKMIGGAKIHVRSSLAPLYHVPRNLKVDMKRSLGIVDDEESDQEVQEDDENIAE